MKKYFFLTIILFVFVLSGCGNSIDNKEIDKGKLSPVVEPDSSNKKEEIGNSKLEIDSSLDKSDPSSPKATQDKVEKFEVTDTTGWQTLKRDEFEMKVHKNWYYNIYHKTDKEAGVEMIIGFATSSNIWEQEPPFTVELAIVKNDVPNSYVGYMKDLGEKNNRDYFLRTEDKEVYGDLVDMMADTFEFKTQKDE